MDEESQVAEVKSWTGPVLKATGLVYILLGFPFFFFMVPLLRSIRRGGEWTEAGVLTAVITILLGMPLLLVSGVGLFKKSSWAADLGRLVALLPTVATLIDFANSQNFEVFWITILVAPPGLAFTALLSHSQIRFALGQHQETSLADSLKGLARNLAILVIGLVVLGLTLSEMPDIVRNLKMSRWQSQCEESGDMQACGSHAQGLIQFSDQMKDWKAGLAGMRKLCTRGNSFACRKFGYLHSYTDTDDLKESASRMVRHLDQVAAQACREGDGRGCYVVKGRHRNSSRVIENHDELLARSTELCDEGDVWACRAVYLFAMDEGGQHPVPSEHSVRALSTLCEDGFVLGCRGLAMKAPEEIEMARDFCEAHPSSGVCMKVGQAIDSTEPSFYLRSCRAGLLPACEKAIGALVENPYRDIIEPLYRALHEAQPKPLQAFGDVGFWSIEPLDLPRERLDEACAADVAEACFALGIEISKDRRDALEPELGKVADYDVTFRKACNLGFDPGCLAYAERLSNRFIGERRRLDRAEEALEIACERGQASACWLIDVDDELIRGEVDRYGQMLEDACRHQPAVETYRGPCRELAYYWAWKLDATPWLFSERVSRALSREHCIDTGKWSCAQVIWMRASTVDWPLTTTSPPWHIEEFTAGKKSCKHRNLWACHQTMRISREFPAVPEEKEEEFKDSVCKVLPDVQGCGGDE